MYFWSRHFHIHRPAAVFARPLVAAAERQLSPDYQHAGRFRQADKFYLFKYTLAGEGCFAHSGQLWRVGAGSGFLCRINDAQMAYYYPPQAVAPWDFIWLTFSGGMAELIAEELLCTHGPLYEISVDDPAIVWLNGLGRASEAELYLSVSRGSELVAMFLHRLQASRETADDQGMNLVKKVARYVAAHLAQPLPVSRLAQVVGMSREHFCRRFAIEAGSTPGNYVRRQRVIAAARLLKETALTGKEVAAATGFTDPVLFNRNFKKITGMTPKQFRRHGIILG